MKKFFLLILIASFSSFATAQSLKKLGLIFDQTTYNFGDVEQWNNPPANFTFTNNSKLSLTILPLFSENDLDVIIPDKPILPGETIIIQAIYYTDGKGAFSRTFPIYFGSMAEPVNLKIVGNIKSLSPDAYIQCPMAKPELSKPRIELIGDVAELETEIPLSGSTIEIIGLQSNKEVTLFSNSKGNFGAKLPTGNYIIKVNHPNYISYTGSIYIGQTSPPLRIRLKPITEEPIFVQNKEEKPKENFEDVNKKDTSLKVSETNLNTTEKVTQIEKPLTEKTNPKLERDFESVKNEPTDNLYLAKKEPNNIEEVPQTLTTYKESNEEQQISDKKENWNTPKEEKLEIIKPAKVETPISNMTFRVLNKNTLEPIESATIFLSDLYNKKNKYSDKTDVRGYSELAVEKSDFRFIATADGYISNEIRILKEDKSEVFKIFLSPVSDLYAEIYEAKKDRAKENDEILNKLSFGKTEFTFARDEPEQIATNKTIAEPEKVEENVAMHKDETENLQKKTDNIIETSEPIVIEKIIYDKAKEDSLKNIIAALEEAQQRDSEIKNQNRERELTKQRETQKIDSLNKYIADLTAKNNEIKNNLEKVAQDKASLEEAQQRDKEKLDELTAENKAIKEAEEKDPFSTKKYQANNIIFLIDVSTSMEKGNKMEMLKTSIKNLVEILREVDRVAIIAYNQHSKIVLESVNGNNTSEILDAIDNLKTGGLTNGVRGITTAYEMLNYYFIPEGNNQIILATDGLFSKYNNEMTENELNRLVKKQADANMKLTVVGFGKDESGKSLMEKLAKNGKGQYIQISNNYMTRDVLIKEIKLNSEIKAGG